MVDHVLSSKPNKFEGAENLQCHFVLPLLGTNIPLPITSFEDDDFPAFQTLGICQFPG